MARARKIKPEQFLDGRVLLYCGDCLDVLDQLDENSLDAFASDPPYHLQSIVTRYSAGDAKTERSLRINGTQKASPFERGARGFMGKKWDGGKIAFDPATWRKVLRVLKPGAHLVAFAHPRNSHRMVCAIEDAGFEIRDSVLWLFGSGFPKSHDVALDFETTLCDRVDGKWLYKDDGTELRRGEWRHRLALLWDGWGTALKPAFEPICLARKPISEGTVAANVERWGTGALHVDACRIETNGEENPSIARRNGATSHLSDRPARETEAEGRIVSRQSEASYRAARSGEASGRFPANIAHDASAEVMAGFPDDAGAFAPVRGTEPSAIVSNVYGARNRPAAHHHGDSGTAARFFYSPKADDDDRLGSKHPTVKPVELKQWLLRLITPPNGLVLDCFAGTGTTAEAAYREGMSCILVEAEPEYQDDIRRRMKLVLAGPDERRRETIKVKIADKLVDHGPLFGGEVTA